MPQRSKLRHSPLGRIARKAIQLVYRAKHSNNEPVTYQLPGAGTIRLYPEGEIAEFLSFPRLFEWQEIQLVARFLRPGMKMIDVGANIGLYSILGSSRIGDTGKIWAFEPSGESFGRLTRNLLLNGCTRVQAIQIALGDSPSRLSRLTSDGGYGDAYRYLLPGEHANLAGPKTEVVQETTLDACAVEYGIDRIDLIKIDVEGSEYRVLLGSRQTLAANPDVRVVFESEEDWCERAGCTQQDAFDLLRSMGFQLYAWGSTDSGWTTNEQELFRAGMVWAARSGPPIAR